MTLLESAIISSHCIVSVIGDHAGEDIDSIFSRKSADLECACKTFWLIRSPKARPNQVQELCTTIPKFAIFIEPATKGSSRPTTEKNVATHYSHDRIVWFSLPKSISPVSGKIDANATALVFDSMTTTVSGTLDLWNYRDASDDEKPLRFILGCSTVCAVKKDIQSHSENMKSRYRGIVAVARLAEPFGVWLR